ncbi:MAG TPA: ABC transporter permease [Dongiaceae bacterium]|nr:ABC transporter permease [Dongiaceae bacterium]
MTTGRLGIRRFGAVNGLGLATLVKRETSRGLSDYNYHLLGPVVTSLLYLVVFRLALHGNDGGKSIIDFMTPGLIIYAACEKAYESAAGSFIFDKHERIIADMLMAPLTALERLLGYVGADCLGGLVVGVAVAIACFAFAGLGAAHPWAIAAFGLLGMALYSLIGVLVGIWAEKWDHYSAMHTFVLVPFSYLSGVFFPIDVLSPPLQALMHFNPLFHVIDGFRYGMTGQTSGDPLVHVAVLVGVNLVLGGWAYRWFRSGYKLKP